MGHLVSLGGELEDGLLESGEVGEVGGAEALASEDAEPLLDRFHPGAVDRGEVGMQPLWHERGEDRIGP